MIPWSMISLGVPSVPCPSPRLVINLRAERLVSYYMIFIKNSRTVSWRTQLSASRMNISANYM